MFALVDCNNFYAACEKLFRPDLTNRPVVVLSNNDGCVVARSPEAKALGIRMGVPAFEIRELVRRAGVVEFSSNYALYADLSARVMRTLEGMAPQVEVYSIDECFLDLSGVHQCESLATFGDRVRRTIGDCIGLPVCVGMAPTKTLAKLANFGAKKYPATGGIVDLSDPHRARRLMAIAPLDEVWGVGTKLTKRLNALGIESTLDLADADPAWIRAHANVVLERTVHELNGRSCLDLDLVPPAKQQILCSRSFGQRVTTAATMHQAVAGFMARAAEKLRGEQQRTRAVTVFIRTNPFIPDEAQYSRSASTQMVHPTADSRELLQTASQLLRRVWRDGYNYHKAGVMLGEFTPHDIEQPDLFESEAASGASRQTAKDQDLMDTIDTLNQRCRGAVYLASQGRPDASFQMRREHLSPAYTTRWEDLPVVH